VDSLQAAGAQHILVWNVPNLGISPGVRSFGGGLDADATALAQGMNEALAQRLAGEGPGVRIFDVYGLWTDWAAGGTTAGGFANTSDACGAPSRHCDPDTALFWDAIHPTTAGHAAMAAVLQAQLAPVPEPAGAALFAVGLGGLLWLRRPCGFNRPS
jgi:outer membrane lipase/esterase